MKKVMITALMLGSFATLASQDPCEWNGIDLDPYSRNFGKLKPQVEALGVTVASTAWTHDDQFEGKVVIFSAKVHADKGYIGAVDENGFRTQYFMASVEGETQFGKDGHEHTYLNVSAITLQKVRELEKDGKFHVVNAGVDIGNMQVSRDLPLAVSRYVEAEPIKIFGTIGWSPSQNSEWEFLARASVSVGYAWGKSTKPEVADTNNMYTGQDFGFSVRHHSWGQLDFDRGWDGDLKKYDGTSTNSREADVKIGYTYFINDRTKISFAGEKRSFRFGPEYEKSRRYLLSFQRRF